MSNMLNDTHARYRSNTVVVVFYWHIEYMSRLPVNGGDSYLFVSGARPPYWMEATAMTISLPYVEK